MKLLATLFIMFTSILRGDISSLWQKYDKAMKKDNPKDQIEILEEIKDQAEKQRLHWDYYISCKYKAEVGSIINWKDYNKLQETFEQEIKDYNEPIVSFYHSNNKDERRTIMLNGKSRLESGKNIRFYYEDPRLNTKSSDVQLIEFIANDYEYALWALEDYDMLKEHFGSRYPQEAFIDYFKLSEQNERKEGLEAIRQKYSGKAMALIAEVDLLNIEFARLRNDGASSEEFRRCHQKAVELNSNIKRYTGDDAIILKNQSTNHIINNLEGKSISAEIKDGVLSVYFSNLSEANIRISSGAQNIFSRDVINPTKSFYIKDTVSITLPEFEDGTYMVRLKSGSINEKSIYKKHSLSIASKEDSQGPAVYVADYMSGEPIKKYQLLLKNNNGTVIAEESVDADGRFYYLSPSFCSLIKEQRWSCYLSAQFTDDKGHFRSSEDILTFIREPKTQDSYITATTITDKGAYTPGEIVYFKTTLYHNNTDGRNCRPLEENELVEVSFHDPDNNIIDRASLNVNPFGSVNGSFHLPEGAKGGRYSIKVRHNSKNLNSHFVQVDRFVLPGFELIWEDRDRLYLGGDEATIKGQLKSYSGHSLAGSKLQLTALYGTKILIKEEITIDSDSGFEKHITLPESRYQEYCLIEAVVTDLNGETLVFNSGFEVLGRLDIYCDITNSDKGRAVVKGTDNHRPAPIISKDTLEIWTCCSAGAGEELTLPSMSLDYSLFSGEKIVSQGKLIEGESVIDISSLPADRYKLVIHALAMSDSGKEYKDSFTLDFIRILPDQKLPELPLQCFFREPSEKDLELQIGSGDDPIWAVATLYGNGNILLDSKSIHIEKGDRTLKTISFEPKPHYPEDLLISVFYFKDGESFTYKKAATLPAPDMRIPLEFKRFHDLTQPRGEYSFLLQTSADVECAVSVFDAASEVIRRNTWSEIRTFREYRENVYYRDQCGSNHCDIGLPLAEYEVAALGYSAKVTRSSANMSVVEEAMAEDISGNVGYRTDFSSSLLWAPSLRPDDKGQVEFKIKTGDKTGRFIVNVLAQDRQLNSSVMRQEITVSLPVEVSIAQAQYLFVGDRYIARMAASNSIDSAVSGQVELIISDPSGKVIARSQKNVSIPAGGRIEHSCELSVPHIEGAAFAGPSIDTAARISVTASFNSAEPGSCSDAVKVGIPIYIRAQALRESHSALLLAGADKNALISELRARFVNLPAETATTQEISIRKMLQDAIPEKLSAQSEDALSLSDVLYAEQLLMRIPGAKPGALSDDQRAEVLKKLLACRDNNGGWAWFEGMNASPYITAALLEQWSDMQLPAELAEIVPGAVQYLDRLQFGAEDSDYFKSRLSVGEYLHVRSRYGAVPLEKRDLDSKKLKEFKKDARKYLGLRRSSPTMRGNIFEKVRKMQILIDLRDSDNALLSALGSAVPSRLEKLMDKELASLIQYAVDHPSSGSYFPNAVMPFRGLLDSELYAHTQICSLLDKLGESSLAERIRLWIMVQKETQQWKSDPAYLAALAQVLKGSEATLESKVVIMSAEGELPFEKIKPSGNGYTLKLEYYRDGQLLKPGDTLKAGDKITANYKIWSEENRSFVKITAPRPASFRPVDQLSGQYLIGWARIFGIGYREVKADRSEYYFDSFPEEYTTISEEFVVSQDGDFGAAASEVQCLYADHYRFIAPWVL